MDEKTEARTPFIFLVVKCPFLLQHGAPEEKGKKKSGEADLI